MMLVLNQIRRISEDEIQCNITLNGQSLDLTVLFTPSELGFRVVNIVGLPMKEHLELYNSREHRAFIKTICAFESGTNLTLPMEIISDYL